MQLSCIILKNWYNCSNNPVTVLQGLDCLYLIILAKTITLCQQLRQKRWRCSSKSG